MFDAFWHWLFAPIPCAATLREAGCMLGEARRIVATGEAMVLILQERAERGDEDAVSKLPGTLHDVERRREELRRLENRFAGLQSKAHAAGVEVSVDIPSFDADELRDEAERALMMVGGGA